VGRDEDTLRTVLRRATQAIPVPEALDTIRRRIVERHEREALDRHITDGPVPDVEDTDELDTYVEPVEVLQDIYDEIRDVREQVFALGEVADKYLEQQRELINILRKLVENNRPTSPNSGDVD